MTNYAKLNSFVRTKLVQDYNSPFDFLPAGKTIYIFPNQQRLVLISFIVDQGEMHYLLFRVIAVMTQSQIKDKTVFGKINLHKLEADRLYLSLSRKARIAVWPELLTQKQNRRT